MTLDITVAFNRYRFLGSDFLLWLWWVSENDQKNIVVEMPNNKIASIVLGEGLSIENEKPKSKVSIKANDTDNREAAIALSKGGSIKEADFILTVGDDEFSFSLTSDDLAIKGLRTPKIEAKGAPDEVEGMILEKIYLDGIVFNYIDHLFSEFIRVRLSERWGASIILSIAKWLAETIGDSRPISCQQELFSPDGHPVKTEISDDLVDEFEKELLADEELSVEKI